MGGGRGDMLLQPRRHRQLQGHRTSATERPPRRGRDAGRCGPCVGRGVGLQGELQGTLQFLLLDPRTLPLHPLLASLLPPRTRTFCWVRDGAEGQVRSGEEWGEKNRRQSCWLVQNGEEEEEEKKKAPRHKHAQPRTQRLEKSAHGREPAASKTTCQ